MDVFHRMVELVGEVAAEEVDVDERGVGDDAGEIGDRVQFPAHPGQVGQAQMPGRVGGERGNISGQRDPAGHL
ncbi:hypothetical protein IU494_37240 [Nocardia terpenica]|uniref:hypothetical protein n=1 Tax=Nocardia terpenica TaxID=455432 RepID=UPI001895DE6F|nr:hypothetical protein [Nocardia terpenica]MBF6066401.1 hypothetical protein [Nocardia terpenica]MBF6123884.1 hypothetical protein [Nocardia terpenica]